MTVVPQVVDLPVQAVLEILELPFDVDAGVLAALDLGDLPDEVGYLPGDVDLGVVAADISAKRRSSSSVFHSRFETLS